MPNTLHANSTSSLHSSQGAFMSSDQYGSSDPVHDLPPELLQAGWRKFWSKRQNRPYFFNQVTNESLWEMPKLSPVTVENFYNELKINISSILGSVPEETVDGIFHAIQNAGFESSSDLHLVKEDDLMCILKPIPRRKLIKEWSKSCTIKESKCKCAKMKNEDANRQINEFLAGTKSSFEYGSHTGLTVDDLLKTNISRILNSVSEETVNNIIRALKYAGLEFLLDLHFVREDDLIQVLKPCQRRKLVEAWSQQGILFLHSSASDIIHEHHNTHEGSNVSSRLLPNNASSSIPDLSMLAQRQASVGISHMDTSQSLANQLHPYMDQTYHSLPRGPPPRVSRFTDHGPLPPRPPLDPRVSRFTGQEPFAPGPLPEVPDQFCEPLQSGSSSGVSNPSSIDSENIMILYSSDSAVVYENYNTREDSSASSRSCKVNSSLGTTRDPDLIDQDTLPHEPSLGVRDLTGQNPLLSEHPPRVPDLTDLDPLPHEPPSSVSSSISIHESFHQNNLSQKKWNRSKEHLLMQVCIIYKKELSCPSVKKNHKICRKIAEDFSRKYLKCPKDCKSRLLFSESECMDKIEKLRDKYHEQKKLTVLSSKRAYLFNAARVAFETDKNSVTPVVPLPTNVPKSKFKWIWIKRIALLRLYTIFKTELSSSTINKESVWQKIAEKVGEKYDAKRCENEIKNMRSDYKGDKHKRPDQLKEQRAVFLDEAENAFENIENPVVFSMQSHQENWVTHWVMSKPDRAKLLQVYSKYKAELSLQNFDVENQIAWGKVSREISEKCTSYYGKRRCIYEINYLKQLYESFMKKNPKTYPPPYFFDEAKKAFESTEHSGQHGEVNSLKDFTVKQERRD